MSRDKQKKQIFNIFLLAATDWQITCYKKVTVKKKKNHKKLYCVSKKALPLQCFNKQMIVLQIKKSKEMKKLVLMFVAVAAISFASCGNKTNQAEVPADSTELSTDSVDSSMVSADSTASVDSAAQAVDSVANAQ